MAAVTPSPVGVSIVIPHYGDPSLAQTLVGRLRSQSTTHPIQIIISDDQSPTPYPDDPDLDLVRREVNGGFGSAVNTGAALAVHPLLLILNSDLEIGPEFIEELIDAAIPWLPAILSPGIRTPAGHRVHVGRNFPTIASQSFAELTPLARWRQRDWWHRLAGHQLDSASDLVVPCDWLLGAALLLPTEIFRSLEGFDERFHMNSEETDLQRRARRLGIPSVYLGTVEAIHDGGGSSADDRRYQWLLEGQWRYAAKWHGACRARALQGAHLAVATMNLLWNLLRSALGTTSHAVGTFQRRTTAILRSSNRT